VDVLTVKLGSLAAMDSDSDFLFDADPDPYPTLEPDADRYPEPSLKKAQTFKKY
jgi:hypothetical protein